MMGSHMIRLAGVGKMHKKCLRRDARCRQRHKALQLRCYLCDVDAHLTFLPSGKQVSIVLSRPLMQQRRHPTYATVDFPLFGHPPNLLADAECSKVFLITRVADNREEG